jgi:hypothetical protein
MSIVGIALVVIAPVVVEAMGTISDLDQGEESSRFQAEIDQLENKITQVSHGNEMTRRTDEFRVPDNVERIELRNEFLIITRNGSASGNITRIFEKNLTGNIPRERGLHTLQVSNINNSIRIEEIDQ